MRTVLIATGYSQAVEPLVHYRPTPLLHIVDKPIIVHIIEFLAHHGFRQFDILLHHLPNRVEDLLSDGSRWGVSISYHLVKNPDRPFAYLQIIAPGWQDMCFLLGRGDLLPRLSSEQLEIAPYTHGKLFMLNQNSWSGWGFMPMKLLMKLPTETREDTLVDSVRKQSNLIKVHPYISTRTLRDLEKSNQKFINQKERVCMFPTTAHEVEPGIWISHGVSIHPGIKVDPPIFIGESCQIKENVHLGPNAIIENNCIIGKDSSIRGSLICQRSFVGESLEIKNCLIDRNFLANLTLKTTMVIRDDFILSGLSNHLFRTPVRFLECVFALFLSLLLLPIYLLLYLQCDLEETDMLYLPASPYRWEWKTFKWQSFKAKEGKTLNAFQEWFKRLPLLWNVIKGDVHFIGAAPRSMKDAALLPPDWQKLYLKSKVGLITLADLDHGPLPTIDDMYASETYYATRMSYPYDLFLLWRWLMKKMRSSTSGN